jgi:hypothetical protein
LRRRRISFLEIADRSEIKCIGIPFPDLQGITLDRWSVCQNLAQAIVEFDQKSMQTPGQLEVIEFVCLALCVADCLSVVTKQVFPDQQQESDQATEPQHDDQQVNSQHNAPAGAEAQADQPNDTVWYPVDKLLKG